MSSFDLRRGVRWENYHRTRSATVASAFRFRGDTAPSPDGPTRFAETAAALARLIGAIDPGEALGVTGAQWSLSDLLGNARQMLDTTELGAVSWVEAPHLHHRSRFGPREAMFVGGGATWADVVGLAEGGASPGAPGSRSIATSGSYLQQSVAGSVATSTAGSRLGVGAVQNMVRGLHLVSDRGSRWIERDSDPVIGHVAATFADDVIRDDALFEAALVHLGGMGIVNGMVIETVPNDGFAIARVRRTVDAAWLALIRDGDFTAIARLLGHPRVPVYYEVQIDPFAPFETPALHTLYFAVDGVRAAEKAALPMSAALRVNDGLVAIGRAVASSQAGAKAAHPVDPCPQCGGPGAALTDLFRFYACCFFREVDVPDPQTWGEIHAAPPAPDQQGVVYTAAFATPRDRFDVMLPVLCAAAADRPRQFLYTLRFVSGAAGAMAFQAFPESVVVDFEGLKVTPQVERDAAASLGLAQAALDAHGIEYRMHWGKLGTPPAAKIEADFGPAADRASPIARWQAARAALLSTQGMAFSRSDALIRWNFV